VSVEQELGWAARACLEDLEKKNFLSLPWFEPCIIQPLAKLLYYVTLLLIYRFSAGQIKMCYVFRCKACWEAEGQHFMKLSEFFFIYQLMRKWIALKTILKFTLQLTLKQLWHVSVHSPSSGSTLFELAKVTVVKIIDWNTLVGLHILLGPC
jgi:hypothetical protein